MDTVTKYKEYRAQGMTEKEAVKALIRDGVDFDEAVDASWEAAIGGREQCDRDDHEVVSEWNRGYEARNFPEDGITIID